MSDQTSASSQWPKQISPQYPEPTLAELDRAGLRNVINASTSTRSEREAARAELDSRTR